MISTILISALLAAGDGSDLPRSLAEMEGSAVVEPMAADTVMQWTIGARLGYAKADDADEGTWLAGAQVRLHIFSWLAAEASVDVHRDEYEDGDVEVFSIPIQVTGIVYLPVDWKIRPYGLAGVGWYYTKTEFSGSLSVNSDDTTVDFGGHVGIGVEWQLTDRLSINGDIRFIFRDEPPRVDSDYDYYTVTVGVNFALGK